MVAVGLGWLVYREPFGMLEAVAMVIIFVGVALVKWSSGQSFSRTLAPSAPPAVQNTAITMKQKSRKKK